MSTSATLKPTALVIDDELAIVDERQPCPNRVGIREHLAPLADSLWRVVEVRDHLWIANKSLGQAP